MGGGEKWLVDKQITSIPDKERLKQEIVGY